MTTARSAAALLAVAALLPLAGCGGGSSSSGGQDLTIDISYSGLDANLFTPILLLPTILGLGNNTPHCTLTSGSLPPGVTVQDGCTLIGTPQAPGSFTATVSLSVAGIGGSFSVAVHANIRAPSLAPVRTTATQPPDQVIAAGATLRSLTVVSLQNYTPQNGVVVSYALASGALPTGLELNTADGTLGGTATATGRSTFAIVATLSQAPLFYSTAPQTVVLDVH
jgi:hypothetical protein